MYLNNSESASNAEDLHHKIKWFHCSGQCSLPILLPYSIWNEWNLLNSYPGFLVKMNSASPHSLPLSHLFFSTVQVLFTAKATVFFSKVEKETKITSPYHFIAPVQTSRHTVVCWLVQHNIGNSISNNTRKVRLKDLRRACNPERLFHYWRAKFCWDVTLIM